MSIDSRLEKLEDDWKSCQIYDNPQLKATSELTIITSQGFLGMESSSLNQRTAGQLSGRAADFEYESLGFSIAQFNACVNYSITIIT